MKKIIILTAAVLFVLSVQAQQQPKLPENNAAKFLDAGAYASTKLTCKIIGVPGKTRIMMCMPMAG